MRHEPLIHACLVTKGLSAYIDATITAILKQRLLPDHVTLVDHSEQITLSLQQRCQELGWDYLHRPHIRNLGVAVNAALEAVETSASWIWILHDDSAPDPGCLEAQVARISTARTAGIIGAKQREWERPNRLLELGINATRTARRDDVIRGELDQGQHDSVEDVLAVSTSGMLVEVALWQELGGTDPALVTFGEALEFGRRVHLTGRRVIVEPQAVIYHAEASYHGLREGTSENDTRRSYGLRRGAQLYNWALAVPLWHLPLIIVGLPVWQLLRAVYRKIGRAHV